jgi:hypothetical protein
MSDRPIAGRIWAGRLRVTASITAEHDFEFVSRIVQEAVYFEFVGNDLRALETGGVSLISGVSQRSHENLLGRN